MYCSTLSFYHSHLLWDCTTKGCTKAEALEAASLHPAMALGMDDRKGKLDVGFDADLVLLEESTLKPVATVLAGRLVWMEDSLKKTWNLKNQ